ncbi:MAG: isoleucine--tRNA ligase [Flavobacteriales bacterium]|nr:isoleucine--tRNA ligase [Flavobacteriales bacterium]|tara:strand:- start:2222 stop:5557 length:3336 start_codon:yes stop_codon:yes gene_type:complete
MSNYKEYKDLNLSEIHKTILNEWNEKNIFYRCIEEGKGKPNFTFYEGPPSANGMPGIHHVIARTLKDLFCRYKTLKGFHVNRKAGWDTHGLPVELGVEKTLNITKEDIGTTISIEDYNKACRTDVMKFKGEWEKLTKEMGYWVDMDNPYVTYDNKYIESVWWLLSELHKKGLLYKGFTIQPYSPKAGTGLSTHELNQPGCYRKVMDTSAVAMFKIVEDEKSSFIFSGEKEISFVAWTTTPWTLPSNTALAVGKKITYVKVNTYNSYTAEPITIILAKELLHKYFTEGISISDYKKGDKQLPYKIIDEYKGDHLSGINYHQLLTYAQPIDGDAFTVILADFVTTEDGTGIVHIAPSFGADDNLVAKKNGIGSLTLVDSQGRFTKEMAELSGQYVKEEFYAKSDQKPKYPADVQIVINLKNNNRLFKSEKYEHSYPHCWRTDKPILYYPMDSWFVKTTDYKQSMMELNNTINWKPKSTGEGRFGNWLENLVDWNLSRSRFWGIPIPIWRTDDGEEEICISSVQMLKEEVNKSILIGFMNSNPLENFEVGNFTKENYNTFDLHRPYVDDIILVSSSGKPMKREIDLIDVWFDSGSMPYAQLHYPFENKDVFEKNFPADFIAEGVDQTRGWFFTLHAISSMLFNSVAYKNVISNGLVLDKNGNKMSKRLGNAVDPFETLDKYGADACRWYMMSNAQPWDNLKFDVSGIEEVKRKFFGTLYNTYSFFALYANIDRFTYSEKEIDINERTEIDRWIISELNSLIIEVENNYENYEPTKVTRLVQDFVINKLSNWHIRLSRRRFWKGEYNKDKISAYQTLYECLEKIAIISAPIAPFYMDQLFKDLNSVSKKNSANCVHLSDFPKSDLSSIDIDLEKKMDIAQKITTMVLSLRKKERVRVRQPLQKIMIPVSGEQMKSYINSVEDILLSELNIKEIELISVESDILTKQIKPNFKILGPKFGKDMKFIASKINQFTPEDIKQIETEREYRINTDISIHLSDVEISSADIPGWQVLSQDGLTVALDVTITESLKEEGLARELVNRIQNMRKDKGLEVTDKIEIYVEKNEVLENVLTNNLSYICGETLASDLKVVSEIENEKTYVELVDNISIYIEIKKI